MAGARGLRLKSLQSVNHNRHVLQRHFRTSILKVKQDMHRSVTFFVLYEIDLARLS
jgi:hypothetical protein